MADYAMTFETVVLDGLGGVYRSSDILGLGDTNTWQLDSYGFVEGDKGKEHFPPNVVIALAATFGYVLGHTKDDDLRNEVVQLVGELRKAKTYNDYCVLIKKTREIWDKYGVATLVKK